MPTREISGSGVRWINLEKPKREEVMALAGHFPFHSLNIDDCLSKIQLTKVEEHDDYLFVILRFPVLCGGSGCTPSQVSFFVGRDYLVTVHDGSIGALNDLFASCEIKLKETGKFTQDGVGSLFYMIFSTIVNSLFPIMESLMDRLEDLEENVFSKTHESIYEITRLRRSIADVRRILSPIRRVIVEISDGIRRQTGDDLDLYFSDIHDRIEKIWELSETSREIIEIYKDTDYTLYQHRMNRAIVILTVISTLTAPAMVLGTIYGMNIVLPGSVLDEPWFFFGPYTTFIILVVLSLIPVAFMIVYFKRLGWL